MVKQKLILVGNGMSGIRCLEEILKINPDRFDISVFGSEPHLNYNRILLPTVLQRRATFAELTLNDREWYKKHHIHLHTGETVIKIDHEKQMLKTDKQRELSYDHLIIAAGSIPFFLPIPGADKEGVVAFRTIEDCQKMIEAAQKYRKAVVIGGGVLGLEAASGLQNLGMEVRVVHNTHYLMERQLDKKASKMLQRELEKQGIHFLLKRETEEILGGNRVKGMRFKDGTEVEADLVVMAVGVRPNVQLARESGVEIKRGIIVNDYMETNLPNIYAVGECVEHLGIVYGLVKPLFEQGTVLAKRICGIEGNRYKGSVLSTQLKVSGVEVFSAGQFSEDASSKSIKVEDEVAGIYKKIVLKGDQIIGAVLFGDKKESSKLLEMIQKKQDVLDVEKVKLFPSLTNEGNTVAAMAANELICNCNGVTKGAIIEAVQKEGLSTVEQVKKCTKASSSCGGCKPAVAEILSYMNSDEFTREIEQPTMCACTSLTEEEVVQQIQLLGSTTVKEVLEMLNWKNKQGCLTCRPALSYYIGMIHPEYENNHDAALGNDHWKATVEMNGTFSVVPQMYGGMTNSEELRKIADVADKYGITEMAITSEQRVRLMGVKEADLAGVCGELNMHLSSPFRNKLQNIEVCHGEAFCRCNKNSALNLAASLEKRFEYLTMPNRVKMAISPCLHNGADRMLKDIVVIGMERGWEIYMGGRGGGKIRAGELLCIAESDDEAIELIGGLLQLYRKTACYLEQTWEWFDRVGLIHIREVLFDFDLLQPLIESLEKDRLLQKEKISM
ncbi:nitrite reductase large subunit NirB [Neobacillus pocheonensis]|uniref:nitrite reductase large subunit NirB n=1 Tax=Neobacillus pocheonensis TaxID=363869 RepID=UPI003D279247